MPTDLQVITPTTEEAPDLQQVFPDELASTGFDGGVTRLTAMVVMLFGAMLLTYRAFRRLALGGAKK